MSTRVAFVLPSYDLGGAQRVLLTLLNNIDNRAIDPILIVFDGRGALAELAPDWVPVHNLGRPRLRQALPSLLWTLRRIAPDVVFSTFGYVNIALLAMRPLLQGRPRIVIREPNTPSQSIPDLRYARLLQIGYKMLYPRAETVICQSKLMVDEFVLDFGIPRERLKLLYNPVDVTMVRGSMGQAVREPGPGRRFVAIGSLTWQKGFDRLLDMMVDMPTDTHVTILGEGRERAALERRRAELGLESRVQMPGETNNPWSACAGADALLLPSRWEGMPNVALEALACGTPVISTPEAGGITDVASLSINGAVTLAEAGRDFTKAMCAITVRGDQTFGKNLLPDNFEVKRVATEFSKILHGE
jgi:glycosyltransferase involved in cell wall biosynthesis